MHTDARDPGLRAILTQYINGKEYVIMYLCLLTLFIGALFINADAFSGELGCTHNQSHGASATKRISSNHKRVEFYLNDI